ncbi:MAG: hypothetical protein H6R43_515 [Nitrospirae bacterium]|nr:hypothetical protein [Nitrospirota bacterium]
MKLLMHICCSNCSIYPLQNIFSKGIDVKGLWFNPNIHPYTEYAKRLESLEKLQKLWAFDVEYIDRYPLDDFLKAVVDQGTNRCAVCYAIRLDKTAETAKKMNLDGFTTSLLASPYHTLKTSEGAGIFRRRSPQNSHSTSRNTVAAYIRRWSVTGRKKKEKDKEVCRKACSKSEKS